MIAKRFVVSGAGGSERVRLQTARAVTIIEPATTATIDDSALVPSNAARQLGQRFGVTKERVRQIEQKALARLKEVLHPSLVDAVGI